MVFLNHFRNRWIESFWILKYHHHDHAIPIDYPIDDRGSDFTIVAQILRSWLRFYDRGHGKQFFSFDFWSKPSNLKGNRGETVSNHSKLDFILQMDVEFSLILINWTRVTTSGSITNPIASLIRGKIINHQ